MSFANFGVGIAGLAQGFSQGVQTGQQIAGLVNQGKMKRAREDGMQAAQEARGSAIENLVQVGSAPNASDTMTVPTYNVGNEQFADQGSARKAAEKKAGSLEDFYQKVAVPKIYEQYLAIDPERAEAWKGWNEQKQVKQAQKHWATALGRANAGDFEGFGKAITQAYNTRGYFEDGTEIANWQTLKGEDGAITGVNLTFKGPDGKEFNQVVNGTEDAYRMGAFLLSPENVFKAGWDELMTAKKAGAELTKQDRKHAQNIQTEQYKQDRTDAREVAKVQAQSGLQGQRDDAQMERLRTGKQLDAQNKKELEAIKGQVGTLYRKGASPQEAHRMLIQTFATKFVDLQGKPTMSVEEMSALADQMVSESFGGGLQQLSQGGAPARQMPANPSGATVMDMSNGKILPKQ